MYASLMRWGLSGDAMAYPGTPYQFIAGVRPAVRDGAYIGDGDGDLTVGAAGRPTRNRGCNMMPPRLNSLFLILVGYASMALAAEAHASPAQEAFDTVYSTDMQRVKAARDPKAAVELATRMLATAREAKSQPAFQAILCEKAYELTAAIPSGQPLAIEAMTLLAACAPEKAIQSADAIAEVRQRQFEAARGEERPKAGEALLDAILKGADLRAQAGAATDACTIYRRAQAIAASIKSDRRPAIEARAKELAQAVKTAADAETLKKQLEANPGDAAVRERLVRLYLVCFDDPAAAAKYLDGVADAALTKFVPAVVKGVEAAPEMACCDIAGWYCGLAEAAPAAALSGDTVPINS